MTKYLIFISLFLVLGKTHAQFEWSTKKETIIIPFELIHNMIIVDLKFNDTNLKMILDTGASKNLIFSIPENDSLIINEADKIKVAGVGTNDAIDGYISKNNKAEIKEYKTQNFEAIFVTDHDISIVNKLGIPINGILGNTFFKNHLVEIDYEQDKIILYKEKNKKLLKVTKKFKFLNIQIFANKPYIFLETKLENKDYQLKLLFDTGLSDGLWVFENNSIQCNNNFFIGVLGTGFSGDIEGKKSRVSEVVLENYILKDALIVYPEKIFLDQTKIFNGTNGSLGGEIIKRFNWVFDYENKAFYFKKNSFYNLPFEFNMAGIEIEHAGLEWIKSENILNNSKKDKTSQNFILDNSNIKFNYKYELKPIFEIYAVRENSPAAKAGIKVGDKIIKINNKKAYKLTVESITNLFHSQDKKRIKITIERNSKELDFEFQLEKIL